MGSALRNQLEAEFRQIFANIESTNNTADGKAAAMAAAIADKIIENIKVTIPPGSVLTGATGGVFNLTAIECKFESK